MNLEQKLRKTWSLWVKIAPVDANSWDNSLLVNDVAILSEIMENRGCSFELVHNEQFQI